jgi:hypothetical protein
LQGVFASTYCVEQSRRGRRLALNIAVGALDALMAGWQSMSANLPSVYGLYGV